MKKTLCTLAFLFLFVFTGELSMAQSKISAFQFGFKIAPNLGWIKPDIENYSSDGMRAGFSWGFVGEYNLSPTYCINSGFSITTNGGKLKYPYTDGATGDTGTLHRKFRIRSLEIPIVLKMRTKEIGYFTYFGMIGFGTSFNLTARANDEFDVSQPAQFSVDHQSDIKSKIRFIRESLIVGLGAEYYINGETKLFGGITFNNGFTNILKGHNTIKSGLAESAISNYFELNFGVLF
ncbi:MAG: porin family protein [Bacteroidetes bacterium]|nr:porin family protein [Bacteroidota bacterium]